MQLSGGRSRSCRGHVHERVRVRVEKMGTQQRVNNVRLQRGAWSARPGKSERAIVHFLF